MDIRCRRCGEPTDSYYLRHETHYWECLRCDRVIVLFSDGGWHAKDSRGLLASTCPHPAADRVLEIEPADNGEVPPEVERWLRAGEPGWLAFVSTGRGCPACFGTDTPPGGELSLTALDDVDAATEGALDDWLLGPPPPADAPATPPDSSITDNTARGPR